MSTATQAANAGTPRIELRGITKIYPSVVANKDVSLTVLPGEIHAVLGENGAGKSTLMKIIYGVVKPDAGEVRWEGAPVTVANPAHARELGIGMVFQHFSLFETLTVAENVALALPGKPELGELAQRSLAEENFQRGEITIVVHGAVRAHRSVDPQLLKRTVTLLLKELPPGKAAALAAQLTGVRRSEAYLIAMRIAHEAEVADGAC